MLRKLRQTYSWYRDAFKGTFFVFGTEYEMPKVSLWQRLWITTKHLPMIWRQK